MRIYIAGKGAFGASVFDLVTRLGHQVVTVSAPAANSRGTGPDRLRFAAERRDVPWLEAGRLKAEFMPEGVDLIVAAHSHDFIGTRTRMKTRLGGIGYHPSLLPRHRGRDAVRWTIHMGDAIAGGSVYWLSERVDGGDIAAQDFVFVEPGDDAESLWRNKLAPMGLRLFETVLNDLSAGTIRRQAQDERVATWEPSWERQPLQRPDLMLIGAPLEGMTVLTEAGRA